MADAQTGWDIWVLPINGERKPFPFVKTNFDERGGRFSPDGRWVAYRSNESGRYEIYVRPFDPADTASADGGSTTSGGQWQVSAAGGMNPVWSADGTELYYVAPDAKLMAVPIKTKSTTLEPGTPATLFQTRIVGSGTDADLGTNYDVTSDGRSLIDVTTDQSTSAPITVVLNFPILVQK